MSDTSRDAAGNSNPRLPTDEDLLGALRSAGWLLEQETQTALQQHGFYAYPGYAYRDQDDATKSREIDVMAWKSIYVNDDLKLGIGVRVIAECKQSENPYALIGRAVDHRDVGRAQFGKLLPYDFVEVGMEPSPTGGTLIRQVTSEQYLGLDRLEGGPWTDKFLATQMTRLQRRGSGWQADNEGIFTSLVYPLAKATAHFAKESRTARGGAQRFYDFIFPVVVTSAPVYRVDVEQSPLRPEAVGWSTMKRMIKTTNVSGEVVVDVVNIDHFDSYMEERVLKFANGVRELAEAAPHRFVTTQDDSFKLGPESA